MLFPEIDPEKMKECKYCPTLFLSLYCWHACKHCMLGFFWKKFPMESWKVHWTTTRKLPTSWFPTHGKNIEKLSNVNQEELCHCATRTAKPKGISHWQCWIFIASGHFGFSELQVVEIFCLFALFTQSVAPAMNHGMMLQHGLLIFKPKKSCCNHSYLIPVTWLEHPPLTPTPSHQPHSTPPTHPLILLFCDFHFHL